MPATRLTARTTYTLPQIGHQRSPAFSMKPKRSSQRLWLERRGVAAEAPAVQLEAEQRQPVLEAQQADEPAAPG